ncbi:MAG: 30S ribosomal protein S6 [Candidatus Erginobacter occultus]|nr:30S ribosomal protein S6 [Candidatus Erginobacter occultus]
MNRYEMINIIDVNWEEGETAPAQKLISEEVARTGATLEDIGSMGRRKLAYPIEKHTEGLYLLSHFLQSPEGLIPLRDNLKLNPAVIRTLVLRYRGQPGIALEEEPVEGEDDSASPETAEVEESTSPEAESEEKLQPAEKTEE